MAASKITNCDSDSTPSSIDTCIPTKSRRNSKQKSTESRKIRKPLMEKKRRARINNCLNELKQILLEANGTPIQKEGNRPAKLEKADILELTVNYLQSLQRKVKLDEISSSESVQPKCKSVEAPELEANPKSELIEAIDPANTTLTDNNTHQFLNSVPKSSSTSFLEGFTKCSNLVTSTLLENLKKRQNELIQRKLKIVLQQHLSTLESNSTAFNDEATHVEGVRRSRSSLEHDQLDSTIISNNISVLNDINNTTYLVPTRLSNGTLVFAIKYQEHIINKDRDNQISIAKISKEEQNIQIDEEQGTWLIQEQNKSHSQLTDVLDSKNYNLTVQFKNQIQNPALWRPW